MSRRSTLTVVVVSYNSAPDLPPCLRSVQAATAAFETATVVVDNASGDDSAAVATALDAKVIRNPINAGFARAVNLGIRSNPADYVLILNPDVILKPDSVSRLTAALEADACLAAVGPGMVAGDGAPNTDRYYLKRPTLRQVAVFYTRLLPFLATPSARCRLQVECGLASEDRDVEQIPGACLLTRRDVLEVVGLFDEGYPIWFEDVDWSWRARSAGYRLRYVGSTAVTHRGGASFEHWAGISKEVVFYRSMLTFFQKHDRAKVPALVVLVVADRLVRLVITRRRYQAQFLWQYLRGSARLPS